MYVGLGVDSEKTDKRIVVAKESVNANSAWSHRALEELEACTSVLLVATHEFARKSSRMTPDHAVP